jgi:hypothetical protein
MSQPADRDTLHLTLHAKWYDKILAGRKLYEFREVKPYWTKRLVNRTYKFIRFKNGYQRDARVMRVEYGGYQLRKVKGVELYCIRLGKILNATL